MTAPELSFATPEIVLCAETVAENKKRIARAVRTRVAECVVMRLPSRYLKKTWGEFYFRRRTVSMGIATDG